MAEVKSGTRVTFEVGPFGAKIEIVTPTANPDEARVEVEEYLKTKFKPDEVRFVDWMPAELVFVK